MALVCQLIAVDNDVLTELSGSLPRRARTAVDEGLRLALGLG